MRRWSPLRRHPAAPIGIWVTGDWGRRKALAPGNASGGYNSGGSWGADTQIVAITTLYSAGKCMRRLQLGWELGGGCADRGHYGVVRRLPQSGQDPAMSDTTEIAGAPGKGTGRVSPISKISTQK